MISKRRKIVLSALLLPIVSAGAAFALYFHIMLPARDIAVSDPDARPYRLSDKYILLVWHNSLLMIYPKDRWVGWPSDYRNRLLGKDFWPRDSRLVFWPRGSYASVPLGDAVKRDGREQFEFTDNHVRIRAFFSAQDTRGAEVIVEMPKTNQTRPAAIAADTPRRV